MGSTTGWCSDWFTGNTIPQGVRPRSTSCKIYNLTLEIRQRHLRWVVHTLRTDKDRLSVYHTKFWWINQIMVVRAPFSRPDTSQHSSLGLLVEGLIPLVMDRATWRESQRVKSLPSIWTRPVIVFVTKYKIIFEVWIFIQNLGFRNK